VSASAARSTSLKYGVSRKAAMVWMLARLDGTASYAIRCLSASK
jgi:hypothetical protein